MNTVCNLLWSHATIDVTGDVRPCCRFREMDYELPNIQDGLKSAYNSTVFNDVRSRMINGEKLPNCEKCWQQEAATGKSLRTVSNDLFPESYENGNIQFLEIGFSTHCNLACRMCDESFSSKWWTIKNPGKKVKLGYDIDINDLDVDLRDLREVKIVGGEPMMAKQHVEFLQKILAQSHHPITLRYYTNGTVMPNQQVLDYWKQVEKVYVNISIDGVGRINEYQRPGSSWATLDDNINAYHDLLMDNVIIRSHSVITVLNIWEWADFYDYHSRFFWDPEMTIDFADYPDHLSVRNMPTELKQKAVKYIQENIPNKNHQALFLQKVQQPPRDGKEFTLQQLRDKEKLLDEYFNQEIKI